MRPPTEFERLTVFLAAMLVTRLMLGRPKPERYVRVGRYRIPIQPAFPDSDRLLVGDRDATTATYRARYGANNPGAN